MVPGKETKMGLPEGGYIFVYIKWWDYFRTTFFNIVAVTETLYDIFAW